MIVLDKQAVFAVSGAEYSAPAYQKGFIISGMLGGPLILGAVGIILSESVGIGAVCSAVGVLAGGFVGRGLANASRWSYDYVSPAVEDEGGGNGTKAHDNYRSY